jgi:cobalt/nickel transport system permease protein
VAEDVGFLQLGQAAPYNILPDYTIPFLGETSISTIVAGLIGALLVAAIAVGVGYLLRRQSARSIPKAESSASR